MSINEEGKRLYNETRRVIREAKSNGRLVLFVGAGASVDSGMPLWNQAIEQIASRLSLTDKDKPYDSLKIPQYYYNSCGKKEYIKLMREIFLYGMPLKTTALHKKLIECQAETIITTNYDHLIEQAAEENAEVRYVISKDTDLPYKNSPRELVKMHGDFENDNFVLKEDDYLQYSSNFKLIETYIKSLIGSKIVVFVGYSLNDPDVKQIFTWVKDVLKEDFQRAYLILSKTQKNEIERDYFKNLGVNIIYTSEIVDGWDKKSHTDQLVEFFEYILEDEKEKLLDRIYKEFKPLQDLNYVYGKYIRNAVEKLNISAIDNALNLSSFLMQSEDENNKFKELLWTYLESGNIPEGCILDDSDWNKLKVIKSVLKKSCFEYAVRETDSNYYSTIELREDVVDPIGKLVYLFDYKKLSELKNNNAIRLAADSPKLYMQQAFICSLLNEYYYAYNCLKNASKIFYRNKDYTWYFLAEFNRKHVGRVCMNSWVVPSLAKEERTQLETEVKAIDITRILETIPELGHNHNEFLKELGDFKIVYTLFYHMFSDSIKANERAKTADVDACKELRDSAQDYSNYETCNYIILDLHNETRSIFLLYLRSVIASVMAGNIPDLSTDKNISSTNNVKQKSLTSFDFYIILRYLDQSDLEKLVKEYEINILPADGEAIQYIEDIADSMFIAEKYIKKNIFTHDIFWLYLDLLSHLDITEKLALKVLGYLRDSWNERDLMKNKDCLIRFIVNLCKEKYYQNPGIATVASNIIDNILDFVIQDSGSHTWFYNKILDFGIQDLDGHVQFNNIMINNLLYICKQSGKVYNDSYRIRKIAKKDEKSFCINIFANIGSKARKPIIELFKSWKPRAKVKDYYLYCGVVLSGIVSPDSDTEKKIYDLIKVSKEKETKETKEDTATEAKTKLSLYSILRERLINLSLEKQIKDIDGLSEIVDLEEDPMSRWLLNIEEFDYSQFDCNWLNFCSPTLLRTIAQNETANKNILSAYKKKQYESKAVLSKINEIIIKYFISDSDMIEE